MIYHLEDRQELREINWAVDSCPECGGDLDEFIGPFDLELGCRKCRWNTLVTPDQDQVRSSLHRPEKDKETDDAT